MHTPGPWRIGEATTYHLQHYTPILATMEKFGLDHPVAWVVSDSQANAPLIAAAPELLVASEQARKVLDDIIMVVNRPLNKQEVQAAITAHTALHRAIIKATGKETA